MNAKLAVVLVASAVVAAATAARAETVFQAFTRAIERAGADFSRPVRPPAPIAPALTTAPLPHLRPSLPDGVAAFAPADESPAAAATAAVIAPPPVKPAVIAALPPAPSPPPPVPAPAPSVLAATGSGSPVAVAALPAADALLQPPPYHPRPAAPPPPQKKATVVPPTPWDANPDTPPAISSCALALAAFGVKTSPLPALGADACAVAAPMSVTAIGDVTLAPKALVDCATAAAIAAWLQDAVQPKAEELLGEPITSLRIASSYSCRTRNGIADAPLSEHARGLAIDVAAFRVGKRWIEVRASEDRSEADAAFLDAVRAAACGPFTTVLGPGSDKFHTDHFHLDLAARKTAGPSRGLFCQ
jgi:hypothetical protein